MILAKKKRLQGICIYFSSPLFMFPSLQGSHFSSPLGRHFTLLKPLEEFISSTVTFQCVLTGMLYQCRLLGQILSVSFILLRVPHGPLSHGHLTRISFHCLCFSICQSVRLRLSSLLTGSVFFSHSKAGVELLRWKIQTWHFSNPL